MKKFAIVLLGLVCVLSLAACSSNEKKTDDKEVKNSDEKEKEEKVTGEESTPTPTQAEAENTEESDIAALAELFGAEKIDLPEPADPKTVDYTDIACTIEYTDGAKMQEFMQNYKNEVYNNKVVKLTGLMSRGMMDKTKNSCLIPMEGGAKMGPSFIVVGWDENSEYPADGSKIEITGVVIAAWNNDWYATEHYIYVLPENLKDLGYPED